MRDFPCDHFFRSGEVPLFLLSNQSTRKSNFLCFVSAVCLFSRHVISLFPWICLSFSTTGFKNSLVSYQVFRRFSQNGFFTHNYDKKHFFNAINLHEIFF